jgi:NitT/TauT family transport system permease protein
MRTFFFNRLLRSGSMLLLIACWVLADQHGWISEHVFPSPGTLLRCCWGFVSGLGWSHPLAGQFWFHAGASLGRVALGFLLASALGMAAGALSAESRFVSNSIDPLVQALRSIPGITWLPLAIVWFGIGTGTAVFLIALAAFFPVYINTYQGIRSVPASWLAMARTLGAGRWQVIFRVMLPGAWPTVCSGLRLALGISWAYVVLGELTGVTCGLGAVIMDARMNGEIPVILLGMIMIALLGRLSDLLLMSLLTRLWRREP